MVARPASRMEAGLALWVGVFGLCVENLLSGPFRTCAATIDNRNFHDLG